MQEKPARRMTARTLHSGEFILRRQLQLAPEYFNGIDPSPSVMFPVSCRSTLQFSGGPRSGPSAAAGCYSVPRDK